MIEARTVFVAFAIVHIAFGLYWELKNEDAKATRHLAWAILMILIGQS